MSEGGGSPVLDFRRLQRRLRDPFDPLGDRPPGTVVVLPSMTLDHAGLVKIPGVRHYEERWLVFLQLLRRPETRVVYVTSDKLDPIILEYALDLVSSLPNWHGRRRLTLFDCADREPAPLTEKILRLPNLVEEIRQAIDDPFDACLLAFNGSPFERELAVQLGIPLYAADPELSHLGSKSGSRRVFAESGVTVANGFEDLRDEHDVADALATLRTRDPGLRQAMIKLNDGFGAGGNVLFSFDGAPETGLRRWIGSQLPRRAVFASPPDSWEHYLGKLVSMGAVVERFVAASETRSPSAQLLISPAGIARVLSTQDQLFSGAANQIFVGGTFPADTEYREEIQELALRVGKTLAAKSVVGLLSVDFLSARTATGWQHYGLEINLRMGGGTAPYFLLHGLVEGGFDAQSGNYLGPDGEPRCFFATDRLQHDRYRMFGPSDVVDAALRNGLHYRGATRDGAAFYMLGALEIGRLGVVAVDRTCASASLRYEKVVAMLNAESSQR
jgi:ATP-grasp domain-containing protein/pheganomycin biosynthesis PGM1-like protein